MRSYIEGEPAPPILASYEIKSRPVGEFGASTEKVPRSVINVLPQIRTEFDEIAMAELVDSIALIDNEQESDTPRYDLLEPLIEGRHDRASAESFLVEFNQVNGTDFELSQFAATDTPAGKRWYFHIAGERRLRAGDMIIERDNLSRHSLFQCSIRENPKYIEALPTQFIENNARVNPSAQDEARAIRKYYNAMKALAEARGERFTNRQCAEAFAVNPDKITDAITFTDYPMSMQRLVDRYPFSTVISAKPLFEAWRDYHGQIDEPMIEAQRREFISSTGKSGFESIDDVATFEVETGFLRMTAERLRRRRDPNAKKREVSIKKQTDDVLASIHQHHLGFAQGIFELDDEPDNSWRRRTMAAESLFTASLDALKLLSDTGLLSDVRRDRLGQLAGLETVERDPVPTYKTA